MSENTLFSKQKVLHLTKTCLSSTIILHILYLNVIEHDSRHEMWLETCGVCLDEKEFYYINHCQCKDLVCRDSFSKIVNCPICRTPYPNWQQRQQWQQDQESQIPLLTVCNYFRLSDIEIKRRLACQYIAIPGSFPSTDFSRRDTVRARNNWNHWFRFFNGRQLTQSYLPIGGC